MKDRVRNFIDDRHWGEDGRYKEILLAKILKAHLPNDVSIGTGFVVCPNNQITSQIDIIIYRDNMPKMFEIDSFIIVPSESVLAIIEVKTKLNNTKLEEAMKKAHDNGVKIDAHIFNGIFAYEQGCKNVELRYYSKYVNNIALGKDTFIKYWAEGTPSYTENNSDDRYSLYNICDLAFGYFVSNLIEDIHIALNNEKITETMQQSLYPIEVGKEARKERDFII